MTILIGKYEFDGPYKSVAELQEKPGLFAILHCVHEEYELIHLAEAVNVKARLELSPVKDSLASGSLVLIALYTEASARERRKIILEIQNEFENDCVPSDSGVSRINPDVEGFDLTRTTR
jgi:hypothetical protein